MRDKPRDNLRVAARLSAGLAIDLAKVAGFGRDVLDGLLLAAINQANVAQINRDPDLQRRYATLDNPPPDEMRRPVSVNAVAHSLRVPFETTRRRVGALCREGFVTRTPKGLVIPAAPLSSPIYHATAARNYELIRTLYLRLRAIGFLDDLPRPSEPPFPRDNPPLRLAMRLSANFVLRLAEPIAQHIGDVVTGLILLDMFQANTQHLPDTVGGEDDPNWSIASFVPDDLRRPVRTTELSERLGIPRETVRRRLLRLLREDRCDKTLDGFIVPARVLARPHVIQFLSDNQSHLARLFVVLAEFGVLAEWDAEDSRLRGAA